MLINNTVTPWTICCGVGAYVAWKVLYALYISPLRNVPGSFWARITKLHILFHDLKGNEAIHMRQSMEEYGSLFMMDPRKVAVCDPDDCLHILSSHSFAKDPKYGNVDVIEPNLFLTQDPELSRQRRRQIGPALSISGLSKMEPQILETGPQQLLEKWGNAIDQSTDGSIKVCYYYDFSLMTFDIISSLGFGQVHRSLTTGDTQIVNWVRDTFRLFFFQIVLPFCKTWPFRKFLAKDLYDRVNQFIGFAESTIAERKKALETMDSKPNDLLQAYIDAEDPESMIRMTSGQVTAETIVALLAGVDTSSNTLTWIIHLLLLHPEYMDRVVKEVRGKFTGQDELITFKEAKEHLPFLEACIYESLRLCSVTGNMPRCIPKGGVVLQGHFIPEGYSCSVCVSTANVNSRVWGKDSYVFRPERFLEDDSLKRRVLTFSAGVRICPGRNLAWIEIFTTMANIFNTFDLATPEDSLFKPTSTADTATITMPGTTAITYGPKYPNRDCNVIVTKR